MTTAQIRALWAHAYSTARYGDMTAQDAAFEAEAFPSAYTYHADRRHHKAVLTRKYLAYSTLREIADGAHAAYLRAACALRKAYDRRANDTHGIAIHNFANRRLRTWKAAENAANIAWNLTDDWR